MAAGVRNVGSRDEWREDVVEASWPEKMKAANYGRPD
jgi:hypothetical protein